MALPTGAGVDPITTISRVIEQVEVATIEVLRDVSILQPNSSVASGTLARYNDAASLLARYFSDPQVQFSSSSASGPARNVMDSAANLLIGVESVGAIVFNALTNLLICTRNINSAGLSINAIIAQAKATGIDATVTAANDLDEFYRKYIVNSTYRSLPFAQLATDAQVARLLRRIDRGLDMMLMLHPLAPVIPPAGLVHIAGNLEAPVDQLPIVSASVANGQNYFAVAGVLNLDDALPVTFDGATGGTAANAFNLNLNSVAFFSTGFTIANPKRLYVVNPVGVFLASSTITLAFTASSFITGGLVQSRDQFKFNIQDANQVTVAATSFDFTSAGVFTNLISLPGNTAMPLFIVWDDTSVFSAVAGANHKFCFTLTATRTSVAGSLTDTTSLTYYDQDGRLQQVVRNATNYDNLWHRMLPAQTLPLYSSMNAVLSLMLACFMVDWPFVISNMMATNNGAIYPKYATFTGLNGDALTNFMAVPLQWFQIVGQNPTTYSTFWWSLWSDLSNLRAFFSASDDSVQLAGEQPVLII